MSNFHSTLSRRQFMKALGFGAAGLGAAAATAPVFHDLDELTSSPKANFRHPWYVKQREAFNPTCEVDWDILKPWSRYDGPGWRDIQNAGVLPGFLDNQVRLNDLEAQWEEQKKERFDIKYRALSSAANFWAERADSDSGIVPVRGVKRA